MKKAIVGIALVGLMALGGQAFAEICTVDNVPAATLLLPYFEVDCSDPNALTTLFSVNNASAEETVAHVTVWSDKSIPVFDFDIYLTGYDVQTLNLRDVLCDGNLPVTGTGGVSPVGLFSGPSSDPLDMFAATCGATSGANDPPNYTNPTLDPGFLAHVQAALTGNPSPINGLCYGSGTDNLVGYITVDDVHVCNLEFPSDPGYFGANGTGIASNHNTLWGDWFLVDTGNNFAQGDTLVHIEAQDGFLGGPNSYTYYGRYTQDEGFADNREPLGTNYAVRHIIGGLFDGGTDVLVWRDSTDTAAPVPFGCAGPFPAWEPLQSRQIVIFDEEENPVTVAGPPVSGIPEQQSPEPFPEETQRVAVGGPAFPVPATHNFGWLYLNLNHDAGGFTNVWAVDPLSAQAYVSAVYSALNRFSVGLDAIQLDSACDPNTGLIP
jgi:hypothetical protein